MTTDIDIHIVIPARKGSKRCPNKNFEPLLHYNTMSLVQWAALTARAFVNHFTEEPCFGDKRCRFLQPTVTTDVSKKAALATPTGWSHMDNIRYLKRPAELATPDAVVSDVIDHYWNDKDTVKQRVNRHAVVLIWQPTNPFRFTDTIVELIHRVIEAKRDHMIVKGVPRGWAKTARRVGGQRTDRRESVVGEVQVPDKADVWTDLQNVSDELVIPTGTCYGLWHDGQERSFEPLNPRAIETKRFLETIDIDYPDELQVASSLSQSFINPPNCPEDLLVP